MTTIVADGNHCSKSLYFMFNVLRLVLHSNRTKEFVCGLRFTRGVRGHKTPHIFRPLDLSSSVGVER